MIQDTEMEKHVHGCLTDEASIMAKDGSTITPAHDFGVKSVIKDRELKMAARHCPQLGWALSQQQDPKCTHCQEGCPVKRRARLVEQCEIDKHAQGLLDNESCIRAVDIAKMSEGRKATMVRQTEKEKHAHGHLQDVRAIIEADIPATSSG